MTIYPAGRRARGYGRELVRADEHRRAGRVKRHGPAYYRIRTAARFLLAAAVVALVMLR